MKSCFVCNACQYSNIGKPYHIFCFYCVLEVWQMHEIAYSGIKLVTIFLSLKLALAVKLITLCKKNYQLFCTLIVRPDKNNAFDNKN